MSGTIAPRINWWGYYNQADGYGRFNTYLMRALQEKGIDTRALNVADLDRPKWLLDQMWVDWTRLNITCAPPYMLNKVPGRQWLYSMTEGSRIPQGWVEAIAKAEIERIIVPCQHNAKAFRDSGVRVPISVVPGGTDSREFPLLPSTKKRLEDYRPYTFLTFADRGFRKGWDETREAFYLAFGGKTMGNQEVRLIIKEREKDNSLLQIMNQAEGRDPRVVYQTGDVEDMREVFAQVDCLVLPSRSEGWGMMHREAASCGLPVITQAYSGMDDGFTSEWAMVVDGDYEEEIPKGAAKALGSWRIANFQDIAQKMKFCFYSPETAAAFGRKASQWIRLNQTWHHSAEKLMELFDGKEGETAGRLRVGRSAVPVP